ncbi:MAG: histidine kinase [Spirulina sp. DLM2.Bin59]|nr:MAG: histidine kinase [Spirulina sp. DLM2.Bin59]
MAGSVIHEINQGILGQLNSDENPNVQLGAIAQTLAEGLNAQACLILPSPQTQGYLEGYWQEKGHSLEASLRNRSANADSSISSALGYYELSLNAGGTVCFGHGDPQWHPALTAQEQVYLIDTVAIALSHLELQTQLHWQEGVHNLFDRLGEAMRQATDIDDLFHVTLSELSPFLRMKRSFVTLFKYKNPLAPQPYKQAKGSIVSRWQQDNIAPIPDIEAFNLRDCPYCLQAWHQAPSPSLFHYDDCAPTAAASMSLWSWQQFPTLLLLPLMGSNITYGHQETRLVIGFIGLQQNVNEVWPKINLEALRWVSNQVSTAIIHHNTLKQVQILVDKRTAQLKGSLDVQARLFEKTRQQVEQLRHLIELKDEFLDSVSHELRTPLTSMKVAIQILRQPELPAERKQKYLDLLEQEWQRECDLIQNLLKLQQSESQSLLLSWQDFDLIEFIEPLIAAFEQRWTSKHLTVKVITSATPFIICSHPEGLERVINELLTNAGKYSAADTIVEIEMGFAQEQLVIEVRNYGPGISPEDQEHIFDKFMRGQGVTQQGIAGTGLGLTLVKNLVKHLGGRVEVRSQLETEEELGETCFTLYLPINPAGVIGK